MAKRHSNPDRKAHSRRCAKGGFHSERERRERRADVWRAERMREADVVVGTDVGGRNLEGWRWFDAPAHAGVGVSSYDVGAPAGSWAWRARLLSTLLFLGGVCGGVWSRCETVSSGVDQPDWLGFFIASRSLLTTFSSRHLNFARRVALTGAQGTDNDTGPQFSTAQ